MRRRKTDPRLEDFEAHLRIERGLADSTVRTYLWHVRDFLRFTGHHKTKTADVSTWIIRRGGAPSSVTVRLAAVKAYCEFRKSPDITEGIARPKPRKGIPRPVRDLDSKLAGMDYRARYAAIFLAETGLRISEAYSLDVGGTTDKGSSSLAHQEPRETQQPADAGRQLRGGAPPTIPSVLHIKGKGGTERLVPLSPKAKHALTRLKGRMPNSPAWLQAEFRKAGITAHQLRHSFGCSMAELGVDLGVLQDLMGHSSPQTTRIYTDIPLSRLKEAIALRSNGRRANGHHPKAEDRSPGEPVPQQR